MIYVDDTPNDKAMKGHVKAMKEYVTSPTYRK